jgi:hypothetical protein
VAPCASAQSEILIVDEIGIPFRNAAVILRPATGGAHNMTTDGNGKICLSIPPGTACEVELANTHEASAGDSTTTTSGRHFATGGTGP